VSLTRIPVDVRRQIRARAADCCEYCRIPESAAFAVHQVDHVVAEKHGGPTVTENLALSCVVCNMHKGSDIASLDPQTEVLTPVYHPRRDRWTDHFRLSGGRIEGLSPVGRVTAQLLRFNHPDRVAERILLVAAGVVSVPTE